MGFLKAREISKSQFYRATGVSNGMLDKPSGVSEKNIELFLKSYPEVRVEWLITGRGSMTGSEASKAEEPAASYGAVGRDNDVVDRKDVTLSEVASLVEKVRELEKRLNELENKP